MKTTHLRIALLLDTGGFIDGPHGGGTTCRGVAPWHGLRDKDHRFVGWCKPKTIETMQQDGLLTADGVAEQWKLTDLCRDRLRDHRQGVFTR